ncbi:hypothetical protein F4805DRAFT_443244 [Annulohypoxylon moriforme]|nr:hypothetical protein F4805DRAFT_443244 [Annulohypoxylon moriforme]
MRRVVLYITIALTDSYVSSMRRSKFQNKCYQVGFLHFWWETSEKRPKTTIRPPFFQLQLRQLGSLAMLVTCICPSR